VPCLASEKADDQELNLDALGSCGPSSHAYIGRAHSVSAVSLA